MPSAENAVIYYEAGQDLEAMQQLTDQGDGKDHNSGSQLWSGKSGYEPDVKPNGLVSGGAVSVAVSGSNDVVDVAALTCYLAGVLTTVPAAADESITRAVATDTHIINSITVNSSGAIAVVAGTDGTAFSATRGAAGGPPWIPTGSIEIAQVRLTSNSAGVVTADEIYQVVGTHQERWDTPTWDEDRVDATGGVLGYAGVTFKAALPQIHSDDAGSTTAGKKVYASWYEPIFSEVPQSKDFVPPEQSHSVNSTQIYEATLAAVSRTLNQGSFVAYFRNGVTDGLLAEKDQLLWFKFKPSRLGDPYLLCQGTLGVSRQFPAGDNIQANCTISSESTSTEVAS